MSAGPAGADCNYFLSGLHSEEPETSNSGASAAVGFAAGFGAAAGFADGFAALAAAAAFAAGAGLVWAGFAAALAAGFAGDAGFTATAGFATAAGAVGAFAAGFAPSAALPRPSACSTEARRSTNIRNGDPEEYSAWNITFHDWQIIRRRMIGSCAENCARRQSIVVTPLSSSSVKPSRIRFRSPSIS